MVGAGLPGLCLLNRLLVGQGTSDNASPGRVDQPRRHQAVCEVGQVRVIRDHKVGWAGQAVGQGQGVLKVAVGGQKAFVGGGRR